MTIADIAGAEHARILAENGITTLAQLCEADIDFVDSLFDPDDLGVTSYNIGQWQAAARSELLQGKAHAPKPFLAVQDISIESVLPHRYIKSGEMVDLYWKSDAEIEALIAARVIVPVGANVRLIVREGWLPESAKQRLYLGGIYTLEDMVNGRATFNDTIMPAAQWLEGIADKATVAPWTARARQELKAQTAQGE